jgi:hypothetical protein
MPKSSVLTIPRLVRGTLQLGALSARNEQVEKIEKMCGDAWTFCLVEFIGGVFRD